MTQYSIFGNKLAQYTSAPKAKHWTAVKRVFRYLKGTRQHKLTYGGSPELLHNDINIYCDADWASDSDRKSISGYVIIIAGGAVAGAQRNKTQWHPQHLKPNTLQLPTSLNRSYGIAHSLLNSNFHYQLHQLYFRTINWQSRSPIIPSSTHAPNILTLCYILDRKSVV